MCLCFPDNWRGLPGNNLKSHIRDLVLSLLSKHCEIARVNFCYDNIYGKMPFYKEDTRNLGFLTWVQETQEDPWDWRWGICEPQNCKYMGVSAALSEGNH